MAGAHPPTHSQAFDALIFGDSITEAFRGTCMGFGDASWEENRRAFEAAVGSRFRTAVFSKAGKPTGCWGGST